MKKLTPFAAAKPRERNSAGGIIGCSARRSQMTNAASRPAPATRVARTSVLVQPTAPERTSPHVTPSAPAAASARPIRSSC